ncbi:MAG: small multi-drug export protein [Clostridia bacterium]|nr:small multi-drug export protein [Clostridia bacterium]
MIQNLQHFFYVFLISMVPVIELRGAIPVGAALDLPWYENYLAAVCGNLLPVPFIRLFIRHIFTWLEQHRYVSWLVDIINEKVRKHTNKVLRYARWGLLIFVAVPLPGTGAWTGALIAAFLGMRLRSALSAISGGVAIAGGIMTAASYGIAGIFEYLG